MMRSTKLQHSPSRSPRHPTGPARFSKTKAFLLVSSLFLPAVAFGQWNRGDLDYAVSVPGGGTVIVPGVSFANTASSVHIASPNPTILRGNTPSGLGASIETMSSGLLAQIIAQKTDTASVLSSLIYTQVYPFAAPGGMAYITGNGATRQIASNNYNDNKWLNIDPTRSLGLESLHFRDVTMVNTHLSPYAGGMGNGLIGSASSNTRDISMGNLTENAFTNININFHGYADTNYLAGGGVIGLRATGEPLNNPPPSASTTMGDITGNLFKNVNVITDEGTSSGHSGSAYIEGGGIIGVDAVSSPSNVRGDAIISSLSKNLFTEIYVRSDDIILGGGVVGVNNNSQNANSVARLGTDNHGAEYNIFGNGDTDNITVISHFSLRGGGVIGINGLSNAAVELESLTGNVFAGIKVQSEISYIKGGGIVGLQSNDGGSGKHTDADPYPSALISTFLNSANSNLFLNANVTAGTYLDGGGVIGLRANSGTASLNELKDNIFKGLTVTTGAGDYLRGGGVVGVSSYTWGNITNADNNWFDDIGVTVGNGGLQGGGVIGVNAAESATATATDSMIGLLTNNTFQGLNVNVGTSGIKGGGVVGGHTGPGNAPEAYSGSMVIQDNHFIINDQGNNVQVTSTGAIAGGGIIGFDADTGIAIASDVYDNEFSNVSVSGAGIAGGGVLGVNATGTTGNEAALFGTLSENTFSNNLSVTSTNTITGGGIIGANAATGSVVIDSLSSNHFTTGLTVNAGAQIQGGGVIGANAAAGSAAIRSLDTNDFSNLNITAATQIVGGGIIGANTVGGTADIGLNGILNNSFTDVEVTSASLSGGGIIGVNASGNGSVFVGNVSGTNTFNASTVETITGSISGGGIIGANAAGTGMAGIVGVSDARFLTGVQVTSGAAISGGGVIGANAAAGNASIGSLDTNEFSGLVVTAATQIDGGGVIGARAISGEASAENISDNEFTGTTTVGASNIIGGGIIGFSASGTGAASSISALKDNTFGGLTVTTTTADGILGGGIIGATTEGGSASAGDISGNQFTGTTAVTASSASIVGGGIIGFHATDGNASAGDISDNDFTGTTTVGATSITGGGIVGFSAGGTSGNAFIGNMQDNEFSNQTVNATADYIFGGGVIGVNAAAGSAGIGSLDTNDFSNLDITALTQIVGGGIIGANTVDGTAGIGLNGMSNNSFMGVEVTSADLSGGGIIGANASGTDGSAFVGNVSGTNNIFDASTVETTTGNISGGGIIGANAADGAAGIVGVSGAHFTNGVEVTSSADISGGGIIGVHAMNEASAGNISANQFTGTTTVDANNGNIVGGGIIGVYAINGEASGGSISANQFTGTITVGTLSIVGGGIVGVNSDTSNIAVLSYISTLKDNTFSGLTTVTTTSTDGIAGGGIVGVNTDNGLADIEEISGNQFIGTTNIVVDNGGSISGGGIVGANTVSGLAGIEGISGNQFTGTTTVAVNNGGSISGGGIVGSNASGTGGAFIGNTLNNEFSDQTVNAAAYISGGGVIGANATAGSAAIESLGTNEFSGLTVNAGQQIDGGGIIGAYSGGSNGIAHIDTITSNTFNDLDIAAATQIVGGGVIGVHAIDGEASAGNISANQFTGITTVGALSVSGGGIIGVNSDTSNNVQSYISALNGNTFSGSTTVTTTSTDGIAGGGIVGVNTDSGAAGILGISGIQFTGATNVVVDNGGSISGGGIVGVNASGNGSVLVGTMSGTNTFNASSVMTTAGSISGGGIIGANAAGTGTAGIVGVSGAHFMNGVQVTSNTTLSGGGIIGVNASGNGSVGVGIGSVSGNEFNASTVNIAQSISGGGVVGANTVGGTADIGLDGMSNNQFTGVQVTSGADLSGGGIVGANASGDGDVLVEKMSGNVFNASTVQTTTGSISGGGIVGANSVGGTADLQGISSNAFTGVGVLSSANLSGGGIIGVNASGSGNAHIISVSDNVFDASTSVAIPGSISGGGIVGANTENGQASIDGMSNNHFMNGLQVTSASLSGGGIIGVNASGDGNAAITNVSGNFFTATAPVQIAGTISGGGIVGAHAETGTASIDGMSNNTFAAGLTVATTAGGNIMGGGVIGAYASGVDGEATIGNLSGNTFSGTVNVDGDIMGGGVIGVLSSGGASSVATIDSLTDNWFYGVNVTAGGSINGGGLVGATGTAGTIGIHLIDNSVFMGNTVTANGGQILGGAVYTNGTDGEMTISDSLFENNKFYSNNGAPSKVYGTVVVDTGLASGTPTLTLTATSGGSTYFKGNEIFEDGVQQTNNSLYFGSTTTLALSSAQLNIEPAAGGSVVLYDPIKVEQDNNQTFGMTVSGPGEFFWGGANEFTVSAPAAANVVTFNPSSMTTLLSGMTLTATNHDVNQLSGSQINVMGGNVLDVHQANLNGHLHFNLIPATWETADPLPAGSTALLEIDSPIAANIEGATVSLSNFGTASDATLTPDGKFYLINTNNDNMLLGETATKTAYAKQGMTRGYNFLIDKNGESAASNKQLVAHLLSAGPSNEARILTEGRSASLALLGQTADWLADHSYQQADLALRRGEKHAAFGGVDGSRIRADTGSHINLHGNMMLAGLASRSDSSDSSFLFGGYFEGGYANYNIHGKFGHPDHPDMKGKGNLRFYGFGLMARQRWDSGFRLEASARAGRLENRFHSHDLTDPTTGAMAKYNLHTAYFGAHVGAGYEHEIDEHSRLDFVARYYWARQNGKSVTIGNGERVKFQGDDSSRARIGSRYTYVKDETHSYYVGLAYEYEFNHRTRASSYGNDFSVPTLKGSSGVGEIGMIVYPRGNERFSAEFGLQGYTGKREGVSGGIRVGWKF
jgi:hypothetical protein